jgi:hypothetical protein
MNYSAISAVVILLILGSVAIGIVIAPHMSATSTHSTAQITTETSRVPSAIISITTEASNSAIAGPSSPINNSLEFNESNALNYYLSLNTSTGLLSDYRGDSTIYLADDQALDYNALTDIGLMTGNTTALQLATQINQTMTQSYGSLYSYWNEVFVLFGKYPSTNQWNVTGGVNENIATEGPYTVLATVFPVDDNFGADIGQYVDLALYEAIWNAEVANATGSGGSLSAALNIFNATQASCANYGCFDSSNVGQAIAYQSYKLALDLIAYKVLLNEGAFRYASSQEMASINETIIKLVYAADQLQAPDGGVYTQYNVSNGIVSPVGAGVTVDENGETTSLFAIAYYLWNLVPSGQ